MLQFTYIFRDFPLRIPSDKQNNLEINLLTASTWFHYSVTWISKQIIFIFTVSFVAKYLFCVCCSSVFVKSEVGVNGKIRKIKEKY